MTVCLACPPTPRACPTRRGNRYRALSMARLLLLLLSPAALFAALPDAKAEELVLRVVSEDHRAWQLVEFSVETDAEYANPFDPEEVRLDLEIRQPDGQQRIVPAFWMQPCRYRAANEGNRQIDWIYPTGEPGWRARFTPPEPGVYEVVAEKTDAAGLVRSPTVRFTCAATESPAAKGYLQADPDDPRMFAFDDGSPFFAVGQNLAFLGHSQYVSLARADDIFRQLHENGANFQRIWTCCEDWALCIEGRKSAWTRTWHWQPPFVALPEEISDPPVDGVILRRPRSVIRLGTEPLRPQPPHRVAITPDTEYRFEIVVWADAPVTIRAACGSRGFQFPVTGDQTRRWLRLSETFSSAADHWWLGHLEFAADTSATVYLAHVSLTEAGGGPELLNGMADRSFRGYYHPLDCYLLDRLIELAEQHGQYLQLCLLTRDLYMGDLDDPANAAYGEAIADAQHTLRYAVARWGYSPHVGVWEYFNEMNPGLPTDRFYQEVGDYLARVDPYQHLRATSTWGESPKDCRHPALDVAQEHQYLRPELRERGEDEVDAILADMAFLREHVPQKPALLAEFGLADQRWGEDPLMREDTELVHFHNALWASAVSSLSGTAMFWWWERLDQMDAYAHYRPLVAFLQAAPPLTPATQFAETRLESGRGRVLILAGEDSARFWAIRNQATWLAGQQKEQDLQPVQLELTVPRLAPGRYTLSWWDTHRGRVLSQTTFSQGDKPVRVVSPPVERDIGGYIQRER